jgi:hypothetical protein
MCSPRSEGGGEQERKSKLQSLPEIRIARCQIKSNPLLWSGFKSSCSAVHFSARISLGDLKMKKSVLLDHLLSTLPISHFLSYLSLSLSLSFPTCLRCHAESVCFARMKCWENRLDYHRQLEMHACHTRSPQHHMPEISLTPLPVFSFSNSAF